MADYNPAENYDLAAALRCCMRTYDVCPLKCPRCHIHISATKCRQRLMDDIATRLESDADKLAGMEKEVEGK